MDASLKARPECMPCALRQVLAAARKVSGDPWFHTRVLRNAMRGLAECDMNRSPAEVSFDALTEAMDAMGSSDPFAGDKRAFDALVEGLVPDLRRRLGESQDPVALAARLAVAGNAIDLGILSDIDVAAEVERALREPLAVDDTPALREAARTAKSVLYILDNAGEVVFDRLLMEQLKRREIVCVVRAAPILNDVTREDALAVGLEGVARIVDPGTPMLGLVLHLASAEVRELFARSDLVISKGQANVETLYRADREVFHLLKAKCPVVAEALGVKVGDSVLARRDGRPGRG